MKKDTQTKRNKEENDGQDDHSFPASPNHITAVYLSSGESVVENLQFRFE